MLLLAMVSSQMFKKHAVKVSLILNKLLSKFAKPLIVVHNSILFFRQRKLLLAPNRIMILKTDLMLSKLFQDVQLLIRIGPYFINAKVMASTTLMHSLQIHLPLNSIQDTILSLSHVNLLAYSLLLKCLIFALQMKFNLDKIF